MKKLIVRSVGIVALLSYIVRCTDPSHIQTAEAKAASTQTPKPVAKADNINALIPAAWHILEPVLGEKAIAKGDLNKDGISDLAAVIEKDMVTDEASPRSLLIAFGDKNNSYTLSIIAKNVILRSDEGGIWGDPFDSLTINRGLSWLAIMGGATGDGITNIDSGIKIRIGF